MDKGAAATARRRGGEAGLRVPAEKAQIVANRLQPIGQAARLYHPSLGVI